MTATALPVLDTLNPEQRQAASHVQGPILVLAGAGSGKTRVLTVRIANLLATHGVRPREILALTFTNKAASEMRSRVASLAGGEPRGMFLGTFHSWGVRFLREEAARLGWGQRFTILDADDAVKETARAMERVPAISGDWTPKAVHGEISTAKNALLTPEAYARLAHDEQDPFRQDVARVYAEYQAALTRQQAVDFDDLLMKPVQLLEQHADVRAAWQARYRFLLVDEYQDTNVAQFRLMAVLGAPHRNVMVVGDDDQSIYSWRGANPRNIRDFQQTFAGARVVKLEQNYRSTGTILAAANAAIQHNTQRMGKTLWTEQYEGAPIGVAVAPTDLLEAGWVADSVAAELAGTPGRRRGDIAILYRTNAQSRLLEQAFRRRGVPYQIVGGLSFYERKEVKDLLAYGRLVMNPRDDNAFLRVVNTPRRGLGAKALESLAVHARTHDLPLTEAARGAELIAGLSAAARTGLADFVRVLDAGTAAMAAGTAADVLDVLVRTSGYRDALAAEGEEGQDRAENLDQLVASAAEFAAAAQHAGQPVTLDAFLEQTALVADADTIDDEDVVTMMTLHASKGLEYPVVFITGLEEGIFPHARSLGDKTAIEEERRLFYVGLTRGMERVTLSCAGSRRMGAQEQEGTPSRFLEHLPLELREVVHVGYGRGTAWRPTARYREGASRGAAGRTPPRRPSTPALPPSMTTPSRPTRPHTPAAVPASVTAMPAAIERVQALTAEDLARAASMVPTPRAPAPADTLTAQTEVTHSDFGRGRILAIIGRAEAAQVVVEFNPPVGKKVFKGEAVRALQR